MKLYTTSTKLMWLHIMDQQYNNQSDDFFKLNMSGILSSPTPLKTPISIRSQKGIGIDSNLAKALDIARKEVTMLYDHKIKELDDVLKCQKDQ